MDNKKLVTKRIFMYLGITFAITYLMDFLVIWPFLPKISAAMPAAGTFLIGSTMFFPAIGVLLTRLFTKEGFRDSWIVPKTGKRSIPYFLFGWFGPVILSMIGATVYFLIFPDRFDGSLSYLEAIMAANGQLDITPQLLQITLAAQILSALLLGPLLNCVTCFGEEWGWRGYLLPKLKEKFGILPTLLISGIIWGVWHAPITMLGHNYGTGYPGFPVTGILAMCCFCTVMGIIFSYITLKTGSCLPAVLAHGSLNGFAAAPVLFSDGTNINPFIGPAPTGIIGGSAFLVCAVIMAIMLMKKPASSVSQPETNS